LKSVKESVSNPNIYWDNNFNGTINLVNVMNNHNCRILVFSSSATVYGFGKDVAFKENSVLNPVNPYGVIKMKIEDFLDKTFNKSHHLWKIASLRYFNPIGAHPSGRIGEYGKGITNNLFPAIVNTAMGFQKELNIYGNDWPTRDGTPIRDYIHVMDVAEAHIKVLKYLFEQGSINIKLNIGTGKGVSVLELISIFQTVCNIDISYIVSSRREGDTPFIVANNQKAKDILNWTPSRGIEEMCRDGWNWKKTNPSGFS